MGWTEKKRRAWLTWRRNIAVDDCILVLEVLEQAYKESLLSRSLSQQSTLLDTNKIPAAHIYFYPQTNQDANVRTEALLSTIQGYKDTY
ncbi:uncharacterized protein ARB_00448 [Trichophyton benhamiae CBS 112371]|uniref:Uncharacterized protein n=1 Tax=Arthroderma benhamiae (strain ATCC MYA-4681 / CBS 112371) TaxID=663331 RepID=D4AW83_ARTBC|nr:uncharacterized protein ARB_00448 [Trichophyton benhamiae CBS 112371]EFE32623.1 hypothetical protein ARB_00448 [Trichophyton benhamiae CBS 112371]